MHDFILILNGQCIDKPYSPSLAFCLFKHFYLDNRKDERLVGLRSKTIRKVKKWKKS